MFQAKCGCFIDGKTIELVCDDHVGSAVYGNYDGKETEIIDHLLENK